MGELFELRPIKKQEDIFRLFILDVEDTLSRHFAPVYAKNESIFGVTLVPFFEEKIVTIEDALIHPWLMTLEGSIDLHLTGTMVISIKQQVASRVAEILTPRIEFYTENLCEIEPDDVLLNVLINQVDDHSGIGDPIKL